MRWSCSIGQLSGGVTSVGVRRVVLAFGPVVTQLVTHRLGVRTTTEARSMSVGLAPVHGEQGEAALTSRPAPLSAAGWRVQTGQVLPGVARRSDRMDRLRPV
jgi:hypothetical protein